MDQDGYDVTPEQVTEFAIREWLAAVADVHERRAVREMATATLKEIGRLQAVERAHGELSALVTALVDGDVDQDADNIEELRMWRDRKAGA